MRITHIAAEMAPIAKIGGLGDVVYGLSKAQVEAGHDVQVILPRYDCMQSAYLENISLESKYLSWKYEGRATHNNIWKANVNGLRVLLVDTLHSGEFFDRGKIYGCRDDNDRFLFFCRTALEYLKSKEAPDVIHIHDWQTAICPLLARQIGLNKPKFVLTIHNMEYQGRCAPEELEKIGITDYESFRDETYPEALNLLQAGVQNASHVTTVSRGYAEEARSTDLGMGMEKTLRQKKENFSGIVNGIDDVYWNPVHDDYLPKKFNEKTVFQGKKRAKKALRERLMLENDEQKPIVANIGRLVPQKGVSLIKQALLHTLEIGGQFILQGVSPNPEIKGEFLALKEQFADYPHVHIELHTEEELTHLIYAGADIFLVPSIFEPCGLTQLIALNYGTIPIVRKTGGLADTVTDVSSGPEGNGFVFEEPKPQELMAAIDRAVRMWREEKSRWKELVIQGVRSNFCWKEPAEKYEEVYQKALLGIVWK